MTPTQASIPPVVASGLTTMPALAFNPAGQTQSFGVGGGTPTVTGNIMFDMVLNAFSSVLDQLAQRMGVQMPALSFTQPNSLAPSSSLLQPAMGQGGIATLGGIPFNSPLLAGVPPAITTMGGLMTPVDGGQQSSFLTMAMNGQFSGFNPALMLGANSFLMGQGQQPVQLLPNGQPAAAGLAIDSNGMRSVHQDYRTLSTDQREQLSGLSSVELGALHVFGRGVAMQGREGGYMAMRASIELVLSGRANELTPRDADFAQAMILEGQRLGVDPAQLGERVFLQVTDKINGGGTTFQDMVGNAPPPPDNGQRLDINQLANNLDADRILFSTWFHGILDDGQVNGLEFFHEVASGNNALMRDPQSQTIMSLAAMAEAADGNVANNSFNRAMFTDLFAHIYSNQQGDFMTVDRLNQVVQSTANQNGLSIQQVSNLMNTTVQNMRTAAVSTVQGIGNGIMSGLSGAADLLTNNPLGTAGTMVAGSALSSICPFFAAGVGGANTAATDLNAGMPANHA